MVGWIIKYLIGSVTGSAINMPDVDAFGAAFGQTASSFGSVGWHIAALAITFGIMIFGIASGIERVNKIMMPLFFVMFIGLAIYIATLPGASEGYRYLTHPDWSILLDGKVWVYALGQAFSHYPLQARELWFTAHILART